MDENIKNANYLILKNVKEALLKNKFNCEIFQERDTLINYVVSLIGEGKRIGLGGSMTVKELGLVDILSKKNTIFTHKPEMNYQERRKTWLNAIDSDFYLVSPQAITLDGKLIFIDGTGNRTAAVNWGPKHIIAISGINKVVKDLDEGLWRIRNISAIRNNIRLGKRTPCVITGKCEDCFSDDRICNILTILYKKSRVTDITVCLLNEDIGY